jgi:Holliday junction resolvase RusA-like endonuclease
VNEWTFTVPGEPVGKGRPRFARVGNGIRTYTPARTERYEDRVALVAAPVLPSIPHDAPVTIQIVAVFKRPKRLERRKDPDHQLPHLARPDVDNVTKAVLDGLKAHLRDEQVSSIHARKAYAERGGQPRTEVRITQHAPEAAP